ncbi:DNA replication/repair protein RecF [Jiella endophytica]|uniref:DNA replication and repair protein RecF n=1 Tax=Jiella endophytica TaxID=2558362 RepID=A0A4Y8REJ3_9HYPH|nr:DNA replication/repair protein RecF [Jiella endophytica]TFF19810.1 DNA replication/repair protein RecF [Jiella endophytica]
MSEASRTAPDSDAPTTPSSPPPSRVTRLRLGDFRNYATLDLAFDSGFVVFHGDNGAGKTNLLEALSLLSPGRGIRRATYGEMARQGGSGGFLVRAGLVSNGSEALIESRLSPPSGAPASRNLKIDETAAKTADELLETCRVLWLTPAMDGLFTGPSSDRRRFLDRMVLAIDPGHGRRASDYERAMRSRNRLLSEDRTDDVWLSGLEAQMAELGVAMAIARSELTRMLTEKIASAASASPFPLAKLDLNSGYEAADLARASIETEEEVRAGLKRSRGLDRASGRTREGAHRADLSVFFQAKDMPAALASTGEQKALLIGLVLAHAQLVAQLSGHAPILLLDEVAAHLDPGRREALYDLVASLGVQAFMTGTDAQLFEALTGRADMIEVAARSGG